MQITLILVKWILDVKWIIDAVQQSLQDHYPAGQQILNIFIRASHMYFHFQLLDKRM